MNERFDMGDKLAPAARSALMGRIRSKNTKPELAVRRLLHGMGYRFLVHDRRLPGTPDLVFPARRKVIFVHGCFWHGHHCGRGFRPATNSAFWAAKLDRNRFRDAQNRRLLRRLGWGVAEVFECAIRPPKAKGLASRLVIFLGPSAQSVRLRQGTILSRQNR